MRRVRVSILIITSLLIAVGVVMVYSSSAIYAYEKLQDSMFFLKRHLAFLLVGVALAASAMTVDLEHLRKHSKSLIIISFVLLTLVLVPDIGYQAGGARRWFRLWFFSFQPSEMVKIFLVIYLADILARKGRELKSFFIGIVPSMLVVGVCLGLILFEPDLGTAFLIGSVALVMLFIAGVRVDHIAYMALASLPILYFAIASTPYRRNRVLAFINPWGDPKGTGFQMIQSFLALGSGGLFGVGLGQSKQKLFYLPASHTDFIFSIIGEELGLFGTLSVVLLFLALLVQGMKVAARCTDDYKRFLAFGLVTMISFEALIHIGVSIGSLPTKGLPLPFISYGGSSLIFHMAAVGLLLNVARSSS